MNLLIKIVLLTLFVSRFCMLYAKEINSNLIIQTNVDSAGLFVDQNFIGSGNHFNLNKESGTYEIMIIENLRKWDAEIILDTIQIENSDELLLTYNFKSQTVLNTIPEDVRVIDNDSLIGFTPLLLETGFEELNLEKTDYASAIVTRKEISEGKIPELKFNGKPPQKEFYGTTLFKVLLGTAIALGVATAYYKIEADKLYEEYKITGDPGLVDNIDHYDGQSAGTFIAMEICVGALIYFFLTY